MQVRNIVAWVQQVLLGIAFILSGFMKLKALDGMIQMFGGLGLARRCRWRGRAAGRHRAAGAAHHAPGRAGPDYYHDWGRHNARH